MKIGTIRTAALAILALAGAAQAQFFQTTSGGGNWTSNTTWVEASSLGGLYGPTANTPGCGDYVEILGGDSVTISSSVSANVVDVYASGLLTVQNGGTLTICSGNSNPLLDVSGQVTIDSGGQVILSGSSPSAAASTIESGGLIDNSGSFEMAVSGAVLTSNQSNGFQIQNSSKLLVTANATMDGSGSFKGFNNSGSTIQIGPPSGSSAVTLTNQGTIHGAMTIKRNVNNASGLANFANQGLVYVGAAGTITLDSTLNSITDSGSAYRWQVENSANAVIVFNKSTTSLAGDFSVDVGHIDINANVTTSGGLRLISGTVPVLNGSTTFVWSAGYLTGTCNGVSPTSPASSLTGPASVYCP